MLIEFRVKNYKSIKEEQVLSLVASKDDKYSDTHVINTGIKGLPGVLKSAAIYGPNAGGKSNLINALSIMRAIVEQSATQMQLGNPFNIRPFVLDNITKNEPTEFELTFMDGGIRYQYGFSLNIERIYEEWLLVYKSAKPQEWFSRHYNKQTDSDEYKFSTHLIGQKEIWKKSTRMNALFLSTAVNLNSEQLLPVFNWIVKKLVCFPTGAALPIHQTLEMLQTEEGSLNIKRFLSAFDISINDIQLIKDKRTAKEWKFDLASGESNVNTIDTDHFQIKLLHKTDHGQAALDISEESLGTQRSLWLSAPILEALKDGKTLVVDELNSSLHSILVRQVIRLFNNNKINTSGAQLIFSTHDVSLLDRYIFRRDQIWLIEKDPDQASFLRPLTEFSPRVNEALESNYLEGRYGGIPIIGNFEL